MGRGLAPVARHLILRDPPTPESAQQQECLQFAGTDSLKVVTSQDENCVFLIGSLDFEHVCDLVFGANLGNGDAPWAILSFDPSPPDFLSLMRLMGWETRQSMRPKSGVPFAGADERDFAWRMLFRQQFDRYNSTNVSMLAGSTRTSRRLGSRDWTVVNLVNCRLLVPHVPCPVPRPVSI